MKKSYIVLHFQSLKIPILLHIYFVPNTINILCKLEVSEMIIFRIIMHDCTFRFLIVGGIHAYTITFY